MLLLLLLVPVYGWWSAAAGRGWVGVACRDKA